MSAETVVNVVTHKLIATHSYHKIILLQNDTDYKT